MAYYAAFNLAKDNLEDKEGHFIPTTGDAHSYVPEQFELSPDPLRQSVGRNLKRLRKFRNQADYVAFFPGLSEIANTCLTLAEEVISNLSGL
nr:HEPN domain-containing protein [Oscillatoria sp. PCC 10802]